MAPETSREALAERGELNRFHRERLEVLSEFFKDRNPVERIIIDLTAEKTFKIGPGFWLYVKKGCGHDLVDITFNTSRDATSAKYRFPISVGECFPWPFVDATISVPAGLSAGATITLEVARFPIPMRPASDVQQLHNRTSFVTGRKTIAVPGTPERLVAASTLLPDGFELKMKASVDNAGRIYVGNTSVNVLDAALRYSLEPGEPFPLGIDDIFKIWLDADNAGEGVEFYYEAI